MLSQKKGTLGLSLSQPSRECFAGEWRRPHNDLREQNVGGGHKAIHDEATASKVGFRGAPIHGTVHWSQFTPLLLKLFGPSWFETGSISVHFMTPVTHLEPVRAFIAYQRQEKRQKRESEQQEKKGHMIMDIWMERIDGRVVLKGTASVGLGPDEMTTMANLRIRSIKSYEGELVFVRHEIGTRTCNIESARIDFDKQIGPLFPFTLNEKLQCITEWHPWYSQEKTIETTTATSISGVRSPWDDRPILPPEALNALMLSYCGTEVGPLWPERPQDKWLTAAIGKRTPVSLFGGCELILHNGPVYVGKTYHLFRMLVAKGETPKTEFSWVRTILMESTNTATTTTAKSVNSSNARSETNIMGRGKIVAEMTLQTMYLKGSFEGYDELRSKANSAGKCLKAVSSNVAAGDDTTLSNSTTTTRRSKL